MLKNKNNFFRSVIFSDFIVTHLPYKKLKIIKFSNKFYINYINIFKLIKEIKQLLKLIKKLKRKKINLFLNKINSAIFYKIVDTLKIKNKYNICNLLRKSKNRVEKNLIILRNCNLDLKTLFKNNIYLVVNCSMVFNKKIMTYQIFNDINNFKKIIYYYIILLKLRK